ncbi:beta-ketoacyl-ACP synthase III [Kitasatospora cathayae]|uniref:Beta-ketoacyl-[acyl-carrier-protein] synthase III n=1 Tax=Kitasatospora cathayae TaxID=3004092 RepID=A0ABY7Q0J4_9ACTN|nr:beta-ketoacyl-ACP synthase III [Kitasatospora sp. HUAS 3-15]WBP86177.1 ketoacyl-ACP synthase III [Kitasatospora sp. HUAS 3-15]
MPDIRAVVTGIGSCLPPDVVSNDDLSQVLDTSHDWILSRTGIAQRHVVRPGTSTGDLGTAAGAAALESAGRRRCDLVLLVTTTPDQPCPATAPQIAARLGMVGVPAFDLSAVCSGFVYGLTVASAMISSGGYDSVLLVGAETYSTIIDPTDRNTAVLFGDGAAAVVLERGTPGAPGEVLHAELGSDGSRSELITVPGGGSRAPHPAADEASRYFQMAGKEVFSRAVETMRRSARDVAEAVGWSMDQIDAFVGHQANARILRAVGKRLGIPADRIVCHLAEVGNTAAASIPLALAWAAAQGRISAGDRVLLTAFGGGLTWGSVALRWPAVRPVRAEVGLPDAPVPVGGGDRVAPPQPDAP